LFSVLCSLLSIQRKLRQHGTSAALGAKSPIIHCSFVFEDTDDLSDNALAAVTGSGAEELNIGGTLVADAIKLGFVEKAPPRSRLSV
jgi:hypothetical protein